MAITNKTKKKNPGYGNQIPKSGSSSTNWAKAYSKIQSRAPGSASAAAGPAPAAAPPPYDPYASPIYTGGVNQAKLQYGQTVGAIEKNLGQSALDYGATLTRDAQNNVTGANIDYSTIDVTNPFSKAALLQRNYTQQKERDTNSYANQGQLYSGALLNQRGGTQFGYEQNQDSLQKALQQIILNAQIQKDQAGVDQSGASYQAYVQALQGAPQS